MAKYAPVIPQTAVEITKVRPLSPHTWFTADCLPAPLRIHAEYESSFHIFKPDKHLRFVPHLGTLSLTVTLSDRTVTVDATPLQASIMELFEKQDVWAVDQLVNKLGVGKGEVGKALGWWAERGVVKDEGAKGWRLLEFAEEEFEGE